MNKRAFSTPELTEVIGGIHPEHPDITPGTWVTIHGLISAPQHNGKSAVVFGYDAARGRFKVHTATPDLFGKAPSDLQLNVKAHNISKLYLSRPANPDFKDIRCPAFGNPNCLQLSLELKVEETHPLPASSLSLVSGGLPACYQSFAAHGATISDISLNGVLNRSSARPRRLCLSCRPSPTDACLCC